MKFGAKTTLQYTVLPPIHPINQSAFLLRLAQERHLHAVQGVSTQLWLGKLRPLQTPRYIVGGQRCQNSLSLFRLVELRSLREVLLCPAGIYNPRQSFSISSNSPWRTIFFPETRRLQ